MLFFNIDRHASVIADINNIFINLGHKIDDWSLSGHHWVMNKEKKHIVLNDGTVFDGYISREVCDKFYDTFKTELEKYDGFVACYPVEFGMLYEKWNKPIILVECIRHSIQMYPFIKNNFFDKDFVNFLTNMKKKNLLYYISNNKGDQWCTKYLLDINTIHIPNLCEYIGYKCVSKINNFIIHEGSHVKTNGLANCYSLNRLRNSSWKYSWKDLYENIGIINNNYNNGSMTIFENYTGNLPMFFPSKKFILKLFHKQKTLSQLTPCILYKLEEPDDFNHPYSLRNPIILQKWIDACDFYDEKNMPYIQFYDSWSDLRKLILTVNVKDISEKMKKYNIYRKERIYTLWKNILNNLQMNIGYDNIPDF